jgi:hypothetical protein
MTFSISNPAHPLNPDNPSNPARPFYWGNNKRVRYEPSKKSSRPSKPLKLSKLPKRDGLIGGMVCVTALCFIHFGPKMI